MSSANTITMSSAHSPTFSSLHLRHNSFSNPSIALPMSQLILQSFRCFTYVTIHSPILLLLLLRNKLFTYFTWRVAHVVYLVINILYPGRAHSPTLPSLYLRHSSFSNPFFASPTLQFIHQPFFRFSYVTNSSLNSPSERELILQPFRHFTYVTTHSPTLPSLYLRHSSFSYPSFASPTSQFIHQPFFRFSYVTSSSLNSRSEPPINTTNEKLSKTNLILITN